MKLWGSKWCHIPRAGNFSEPVYSCCSSCCAGELWSKGENGTATPKWLWKKSHCLVKLYTEMKREREGDVTNSSGIIRVSRRWGWKICNGPWNRSPLTKDVRHDFIFFPYRSCPSIFPPRWWHLQDHDCQMMGLGFGHISEKGKRNICMPVFPH